MQHIYDDSRPGYRYRSPAEIAEEQLYLKIANGIIHVLNMETYVTPAFKKNYLCTRITLSKLVSITYFDVSNDNRLVKITLKI